MKLWYKPSHKRETSPALFYGTETYALAHKAYEYYILAIGLVWVKPGRAEEAPVLPVSLVKAKACLVTPQHIDMLVAQR